MATDNYKHDGAVKIKLSHDNDEITVWPSVEAPGSVTIALLDSEEPRTNVGIASPPECDALIAAIGRALGRAAPASTPLADAFDVLANERDAQGKACWNTDGDGYHGEATAYRHAAAMVREQGATVPRAGVARVLAIHAQIAEESGEYRANLIELLLSELDKVRATLAAAPTPKEPGHADG